MKKFIALFICVFIALLFEGCAPYAYTSQNDLPYNDEQIEPAPKPKAKPSRKKGQACTQAPQSNHKSSSKNSPKKSYGL